MGSSSLTTETMPASQASRQYLGILRAINTTRSGLERGRGNCSNAAQIQHHDASAAKDPGCPTDSTCQAQVWDSASRSAAAYAGRRSRAGPFASWLVPPPPGAYFFSW